MTRFKLPLLMLLVVPLLAGACGGGAREDETARPAVLEHLKGTDIERVRLTSEAARRIGIRTAAVRADGSRLVIPYAALLYDADGKTWTYTSPKPLVFQRHDVTVSRIAGRLAVLSSGPAVGTPVVTEGATEIWGVEYGGIEED